MDVTIRALRRWRVGVLTLGWLVCLMNAPWAGAVTVVVDEPAELSAQRAWAWEQGGDRFVLLDGRASVRVGVYGFEAQRALVRIRAVEPSKGDYQELAVWLEQARPMGDEAGVITGQGSGLLVTAATRGGVQLAVDAMVEQRPRRADDAPTPTVEAGLNRFERWDRAQQSPRLPVPPVDLSQVEALKRQRADDILQHNGQLLTPLQPAPPEATPEASSGTPEVLLEARRRQAEEPRPDPGVLPTRGAVSYTMDQWALDLAGENSGAGGEAILSLLGGVRVVFEDFQTGRVVTLKAQRVVMFLDRDALEASGDNAESGQVAGDVVRGIYLEDNAVISDGDYTVRAPRVYYDVAGQRAVLLEAVMYTYDMRRQLPMYLRASALRQTAARSFEATDARLTTSDFAVPHIAIGTGKVRISEYEDTAGNRGQAFEAQDITLRANDVPVFWWPGLSGRGRDLPIRRISAGYRSDNGVEVLTRWDAFALAGAVRPDGVDATIDGDYLGDRGPAVGGTIEYDQPTQRRKGKLEAYYLPSDNGTDELGANRDIEQDGNARGYFRGQHRQQLGNGFDLTAEIGSVSDETFFEALREEIAYSERPLETSLYLNRTDEETQFTALLKTDINEFISQTALLQSPGFVVERFPELGYSRVGTSLWDDRLTWFSENRASVLRARFSDSTPEDYGLNINGSLATFGIPETTSFRDAARADGFPTDTRLRLDTRQEIAAPLQADAIDITPFVVGRLTGYDDGFEDYRGEDEQLRAWGAAGVRVGTELHKSDSTLQNRTLDLDGLRHIVEPSVTAFYAGSNIDSFDLPNYDEDVERLAEGGILKLGVVNTLQTRRGGPGRQRTVDWLTLNSQLVLRSDNADEDDDLPIARYYDYRPEYTRGGDHVYNELTWRVTESFATIGEAIWSLETSRVEQWRVSGILTHSQRAQSVLTYTQTEPFNTELLRYALAYELTRKYQLLFSQTFDLADIGVNSEARGSTGVSLIRRFPQFRLGLSLEIDSFNDRESIGIVLIPDGLDGSLSSSALSAR